MKWLWILLFPVLAFGQMHEILRPTVDVDGGSAVSIAVYSQCGIGGTLQNGSIAQPNWYDNAGVSTFSVLNQTNGSTVGGRCSNRVFKSWPSSSNTYSALTLSINTSGSCSTNDCGVGIVAYSLNAGSTWTNIQSTSGWSQVTNTITLSTSQVLGNIWVVGNDYANPKDIDGGSFAITGFDVWTDGSYIPPTPTPTPVTVPVLPSVPQPTIISKAWTWPLWALVLFPLVGLILIGKHMRRFLCLLILAIPLIAYGQNVRFDSVALTTKGIQGQQVSAPVSTAVITVCTSGATGIPCSPQVTTYNGPTTGTACPGSTQVTLTGSSLCQSTGDTLGNFGFWVPAGNYTYSVSGPGVTPQLYSITMPIITGSSPTFGAVTATSITAGLIQNVVQCDSQAGADIGAKCNAAYTAGNCATQYCTIQISAPGPNTVTIPLVSGSVTLPVWTYTTDMVFPTPVDLECTSNVWLNYTGTGKAIKHGADGLTLATANPLPYITNGCGFTGGALMTAGLYHNRFVIKSYVMNVKMWNFGNSTAYNIQHQAENWYSHVQNVWMWSQTPSPVCYNGVLVNDVATDNTTYDSGDSFVRFLGVHIQNITQACHGVGINVNSFKPDFNQVDILGGFDQLVRLRRGAVNASFIDFYGENQNLVAGACGILYGDLSTDPAASIAVYNDSLTINNFYINVHNTDFGSTVHPICPATSSTGIQNATFNGITVSQFTAGQPIVVQNNNASQTGNVSNNAKRTATSGIFPSGSAIGNFHTTGGSITGWGGTDEQLILQNGVPLAQQDTNGVTRFGMSNTVGGVTNMTNGGILFLSIDPTGVPTLGTSTTSFSTLQGHTQVVGDFQLLEQTAPSAVASRSVCYADSTAHALKCAYNNGTFFQIPQVITATSAAFATATTVSTCVQNVTAVTGATTAMAVAVSPVTTPGVGAVYSAFVSSAGNVTITECAAQASAGGTIAFNIRVFP